MTTTLHVTDLLQSCGVLAITWHLQPPEGDPMHTEPLASELRVAEHDPNVKPESHASGPKSET